MTDPAPETPLRKLALRGSMYMAVRQGVAIAIGVVGVVILTRQIGPSAYGEYVGALAVVAFLTSVARFGVETFLIRRPEPPDGRVYRTAFTLMLASGTGVALLGLVSAPLTIGRLVGDPFVAPFEALVLAIPLSVLLAPGLASLERDLRYRRVALIELLNPLAFYAVAVPWAIAEPSVWAPVAGYLSAQAVSFVSTIVVSDAPVGLAWSRTDVREMIRFGTPLTLVTAFTDGRLLVNPVVVGGLLGPAAVGHVGLALRIADMLRFISRAGSRVSIAALSRVAGERDRLTRALSDGMFLQILAVIPLYAGFALVSRQLVPALLGSDWDETVAVFPLIAVASFVFSFMSLHMSLLFVLGRSSRVLVSSALSLALLAAGSYTAIALSDSVVAYGVGEVLSLAGLLVVARATAHYVSIPFVSFAPWLAASLPPLFFPWAGLPWGMLLYVPALLVLARRSERNRIAGYVREFLPRGG